MTTGAAEDKDTKMRPEASASADFMLLCWRCKKRQVRKIMWEALSFYAMPWVLHGLIVKTLIHSTRPCGDIKVILTVMPGQMQETKFASHENPPLGDGKSNRDKSPRWATWR